MSDDFDIQAGSRGMTAAEIDRAYPKAHPEAEHCLRVASAASVPCQVNYGAGPQRVQALTLDAAIGLVLRERQTAREPLEARVRELENRLTMTEQRAAILEQMRVENLRETFDPLAVRELLDADHAYRECTTTLGNNEATTDAAYRRLRLAVQCVRESEKK